MKQVAKAILVDDKNKYLLLQRSEHPTFPNDPDLPGGAMEDGEGPQQTMLREVQEEIGVELSPQDVELVYSGAEFSVHSTVYSLFVCHVKSRPAVTISWEHDSYEWLPRNEFLAQAKVAKDTYMHMVYAVLTKD